MIRKRMVRKMLEKMKKIRLLLITSLVCMLPSVYGLLKWNELPDKLPTHWNAQGVVDGWSSKEFAVFGLPLMLVGFNIIGFIALSVDPKGQNQGKKMKALAMWIFPVVSIFACTASLNGGLEIEGNMSYYALLFLGIILVLIGNYLPKCKQNYTVGIKVPWTLDSEANWNKTHRFAGFLWMIAGIVMITATLLECYMVVIPCAIVAGIVPIVYSFVLYKKGV